MTTREAGGMVGVWLDVAPEREEEFNAWYELEHIADVVGVDGFLSGRRYYDAASRLRFLALYEAVDETVEPGPGFQGIVARPTPWTTRIRGFFADQRRRSNYRRIADSGTAGEPGAIVTVDAAHAPDPARGAALQKTLAGCTRYRAFHVAGEPAMGFEIYDFADIDAARAALARCATAPGDQATAREAIGTPHVKQAPDRR